MQRLISCLALAGLVSLLSGQNQQSQLNEPAYQPAVPAPSFGAYGGGFGYGGYGAGTTAAGSALSGMANAISAQGDYNLSTSAAAVNLTQAQKQEIQNRQDYTNTYFEMQETNRQARTAQALPRPPAEFLSRMAHEAAPKPLSPGELNTVTGKLNWPAALQLDSYADERAAFEALFATYSQLGTLKYTDQVKARDILNAMNKQLKSQVREIPSESYMSCKEFLRSLMLETCKCQLG